MFKLEPYPEPDNFATRVRIPGLTYLANPTLNKKGKVTFPRNRNYWNRVKPQLEQLYELTCAYFCIKIDTSQTTSEVDHFLHKSAHPQQAYEWNNYRLSCHNANTRKGTKTIIDPFIIEDDWFHLDLESGFLRMNSTTTPTEYQKLLEYTISVEGLDLNSKELRKRRARAWQAYCGQGTINYTQEALQDLYPLVFIQAHMQGLL